MINLYALFTAIVCGGLALAFVILTLSHVPYTYTRPLPMPLPPSMQPKTISWTIKKKKYGTFYLEEHRNDRTTIVDYGTWAEMFKLKNHLTRVCLPFVRKS